MDDLAESQGIFTTSLQLLHELPGIFGAVHHPSFADLETAA